MAEPGRTVRVSGLPTDIDEDRLIDRLLIHFLRTRNGGGEIDSVTIVKATPVSALITFEESRVAQRVIQQSRHILEVDGKKYKLTATEHCESLHPDKVILRLSATVDCRQLPGGIQVLTSLYRSHPDVHISFTEDQFCTLHGAYSAVQSAIAQLLGDSRIPHLTENKKSDKPAPSSFTPVQTTHNGQEVGRQSTKHHGIVEQKDKIHIDPPSDEYNSNSHGDLTPSGYGMEKAAQTDGAALLVSEQPTTSEEDFSLMMDADMFQYLQKHCQKEYQDILKKYGVEVVDMTNQGLTTLFLQVVEVAGKGVQEHVRLELSKKAISKLYQENESKICRTQLLKSILSPRVGLQRALENLTFKFPKLLLKEDDKNIYVIGSSSDVSDARKYLLLDLSSDSRGTKDDVASLLRFPSYASTSLNAAGEGSMSLTNRTLDNGTEEIQRSEEEERRTEGAKKYKLAARFKDSGLPALGNRPLDCNLRGQTTPSRKPHSGLMLGHDVLSGTEGNSSERVSRAKAQNIGEDILFKSGSALPLSSPLQNSNLMETRPKTATSPLSTTLLPSGSGSSLRRASSFSGTPQQKAQVVAQKSRDDSSKSTVSLRGRSSSFSAKTERDVFRKEIRVSTVLWKHIKEAYRARVDDLTSDVLIKESRLESGVLAVTLTGASSSTVSSCQQGLQKLIDSVNVDFSVQELRLSELGVTDSNDETLQACCTEVSSRFKKVTVLTLKNSLFLVGPKLLCSKVAATLQEVFSGDLIQIPEQRGLSISPTPGSNPSSFSKINENQAISLHCNSNTQGMPESKTAKAGQAGGGQERRANHSGGLSGTERVNGSVSHSLTRRDPVVKEKVKITSIDKSDRQKTEAHEKHANGVGSTTAHTDGDSAFENKERKAHYSPNDIIQQTQAGLQEIPTKSRPGQGDPGSICICGQKGLALMRTNCGVTLCPKCLDTIHTSCRVCHETTAKPQGIQGKMNISKLQMSLQGHREPTIKIIYWIPDGIQGEGHPSPGKPFQGGTFEAYLPDCDEARKLLPRLEEAFRQGLTFTVVTKETGAKVVWDCVPHKTSTHGGKSGCGYPDKTYLARLSQVLDSCKIK